ncbi:ornithine decarboxylase [Pseudomonas sp. MLB6B]
MIILMHSQVLDIAAWPGVQLQEFDALNIAQASALLLSANDILHANVLHASIHWKIPVFLALTPGADYQILSKSYKTVTIPLQPCDERNIELSALSFESAALPPFTRAVAKFIALDRHTFACPGHQGGRCYEDHPAGVRFKRMLGPGFLKLDVPHAAPELGDVLSHEGPVQKAEQLAARVFNADDTWFVLNGTSTANKIVASALLTSGDLVLMDRNNHKSVFIGALIQCGALPVYIETLRDDDGILGGYKSGALEQKLLRSKANARSTTKSNLKRPFRLAIIQHETCDGIIVDARAIINRIGSLCDYILFDAAWSGYELFVPKLKKFTPLGLDLSSESPGIIVTQSVHKQMFGLSQASQIHKQDRHIRSQHRYCPSYVFNSAFMQHASTSPSYPLFMSLEINAAMHANGEGIRHWKRAVENALFLMDQVKSRCRIISPVAVHPYQFEPRMGAASLQWQGFEPALHHRDPCKAIFLTKPHDVRQIKVPACLVTRYLQDHDITPEKTDLYNFTMLITPSVTENDIQRLVQHLARFEQTLASNTAATQALPSLIKWQSKLGNQSLNELSASANDIYAQLKLESLQAAIFSSSEQPVMVYSPQLANQRLIKNRARLVPVADALDLIAAECIIPYPPGIVCVAPGERFTRATVAYLAAIETLNLSFPWLAQHVQGLHEVHLPERRISLGVFVIE